MAVPAAVLHVSLGLSRLIPPRGLSPLSATLASRVIRKSFACHSYEKTPGGWGPSFASRTFQPSNLSTFKPSSATPCVSFFLVPPPYPRWSTHNTNPFIHFHTLPRRNGVGGTDSDTIPQLSASPVVDPGSFTGATRFPARMRRFPAFYLLDVGTFRLSTNAPGPRIIISRARQTRRAAGPPPAAPPSPVQAPAPIRASRPWP